MKHDTAIQLAYLVTGIDTSLRAFQRANPEQDHPMTEAGGHIEMVTDMVLYAQDVADLVGDPLRKQEFPGVFEYEVTEELGAWMGRQAVQPTRAEFGVELKRRDAEFFGKGTS